MRRVLFCSKSPEAASTRYRALQVLPLLEERGWRAEHRVAPKSLGAHAELLRAATSLDVVVVLRRTFNPPMRFALRRRHFAAMSAAARRLS
jgi:hypothetical protein